MANGALIRWAIAISVVLATSCCESVSAGVAVADIVGQVSQASYTDYIENLLYTHLGDNRGFGPEHDLARDKILAQMKSLGLKTSLHPFLSSWGTTCYNVVGDLYGTTRPNDIYILGAHYDSAGTPGADDNASGCAGLLEAARVLSQYEFEATLLFIAFDREETGKEGSKACVKDHKQDTISGMVCLDMIAYDPKVSNKVSICGDANSTGLKTDLADAIRLYGNGLSYADSGPVMSSDYLAFEDAGIPACLLIESSFSPDADPYYHTLDDSADTPGYLDYAFGTNVVRSATGFLATVAGLFPERTRPFRPVVDFNGDGKVDIADRLILRRYWDQNEPSVDIAPPPAGDGKVDDKDLEVLMSYWGQEVNDPTLVSHWRLDDANGIMARDSAGVYDGVVHGGPVWQPGGGKVQGALQFDGVDDYVSTQLAWDPAGHPFTVLAWVKGGRPGQTIISQKSGANWLSTDPNTGWLTTEIKDPQESGDTPIPQNAITDGQWHRVGLVCDGSKPTLHLYVDDVEVTQATQATSRPRSSGGLQIGAGKNLELGSLWSGLIDDVRIYNRAVKP